MPYTPLFDVEINAFKEALNEAIRQNFGALFGYVYANPCFKRCVLWDVKLIYPKPFAITFEEPRAQIRDLLALRVARVLRKIQSENIRVTDVTKEFGNPEKDLSFLLGVVSTRQ